ncbi:hypothetical protein ABIC27_006017 [Streptomyces sp. PvR034]
MGSALRVWTPVADTVSRGTWRSLGGTLSQRSPRRTGHSQRDRSSAGTSRGPPPSMRPEEPWDAIRHRGTPPRAGRSFRPPRSRRFTDRAPEARRRRGAHRSPRRCGLRGAASRDGAVRDRDPGAQRERGQTRGCAACHQEHTEGLLGRFRPPRRRLPCLDRKRAGERSSCSSRPVGRNLPPGHRIPGGHMGGPSLMNGTHTVQRHLSTRSGRWRLPTLTGGGGLGTRLAMMPPWPSVCLIQSVDARLASSHRLCRDGGLLRPSRTLAESRAPGLHAGLARLGRPKTRGSRRA